MGFKLDLFRRLFCHARFQRMHRLMFALSLRGMGLLNFENDHVSGEDAFLRKVAAWRQKGPLVVFDVGANVGDYARLIRRYAPQAEVYAFEPHPETFAHLTKDAAMHGYQALNLGLSDVAGSQKIYDYADRGGTAHASLYQAVIEDLHRGVAAAWDVDLTSLDAFCRERGVERIHLLKIDTEGNELRVLQGARETLQAGRIDLIHFEFNGMNAVSRSFFRDFYELLPDFDFYRLLPEEMLPLGAYDPLFCELYGFQNIVAVRRASDFRPLVPIHG